MKIHGNEAAASKQKQTAGIARRRLRYSNMDSAFLPMRRNCSCLSNVKLTGEEIWNEIDKDIKTLSMKTFKAKLSLLVNLF